MDLRSGESFSYNPLNNPYKRDLNQITLMQLYLPSPLKWTIDETLMN